MFACCSGKIVIQQSEIDGGGVPPRPVLQPRKSGKFWQGGGCLPCRKFQLSRNKIRTWLRQQDTYTLHRLVRYRFKKNRVIFGGIDKEWEADVVIMDSLSKENNGTSTF